MPRKARREGVASIGFGILASRRAARSVAITRIVISPPGKARELRQ
jgi:hypothetical protein